MKTKLLSLLAAATLAGCTSSEVNTSFQIPGLNSNPSERRIARLESIADHTDTPDSHYSIVEGVLYVAMPHLPAVTQHLGIDLSVKDFQGISIGDGLRIKGNYQGKDFDIEQVVAADSTIDTPVGRIGLSQHSVGSLDKALEQSVGAPVYVTQFNSTPATLATPGEIVFHGASRFYDVSGNQKVSGSVALPMTLMQLITSRNLGNDAHYASVYIPAGNPVKGINSVMAFVDLDSMYAGDSRQDMFLGHRYIIGALSSDSFWTDFREVLQEVGGLGHDVTGITGALRQVTSDLIDIKTNQDLLDHEELFLPSEQVPPK